MSQPEYKQPPPPYTAEAPPPGSYGFQVPHMQQPTVHQPLPTGSYYPNVQPQAYPGPVGAGSATTVTIQPPAQVILINGCPNCRAGVLEDEFSCLGICCAIVFFPMGLLCCLLLRERRCTNCRSTF